MSSETTRMASTDLRKHWEILREQPISHPIVLMKIQNGGLLVGHIPFGYKTSNQGLVSMAGVDSSLDCPIDDERIKCFQGLGTEWPVPCIKM